MYPGSAILKINCAWAGLGLISFLPIFMGPIQTSRLWMQSISTPTLPGANIKYMSINGWVFKRVIMFSIKIPGIVSL